MEEYKPSKYNMGHCVKDYMSGNTRIRICDDYCSYPDQEERNKQIIENIADILYRNELKKMTAKE